MGGTRRELGRVLKVEHDEGRAHSVVGTEVRCLRTEGAERVLQQLRQRAIRDSRLPASVSILIFIIVRIGPALSA